MDSFNQIEASLTKGSFVHKPSKSKKKKEAKLSNVDNYCDKEFKKLWSEIEFKIQYIESSSYEKTFEAITKFVSTCIQFPLKQMDEIPAAVLQMGVNMPDHSNILQHLENLLRLKENFTVILDPRKCHNFSSIIQMIDNQLQNQFCEDTSYVKQSPRKKISRCSPKQLKRLIFIIQDVETFSIEILEELILNCKIYSGKLPIVLIFGMSSAMVTLQNILPQRILCHLGIETFQSFAAAEYLTRIIEEVVISPQQPFKLGPKVFRLVVDTVLYHDFSVTNFMHLLHFSLLKHFYNNKGAALLCSEFEIEKKISSLKNEELQFLKKLPSLQVYKENNPDIASDFNNSSSFKLLLSSLMKSFFAFQNIMIVSLKVLCNLTKDLPGCPLGRQFREIYLLNLEKEIYDSAPFKEAEKLLKFQSQNELLSKLKSCMEVLNSYDQNVSKDLLEIVKQSIKQLTELTSEDFDKKFTEKSSTENEVFANRFELQEKMRSSIKNRRSKFEAVRNEIVENILSFYKNIFSPALLPLHEIFLFDEAYACKKHLMPSPRVVLCSALSNPCYYLQCKCCKISETTCGEIPTTMPDISVLYKLHLECGKLINLCDWLEAFKSLKYKGSENKRRGTSTKTDDSKLNIRFLHAATELQLLGFIKPTKRKTDHVARLTFGTF